MGKCASFRPKMLAPRVVSRSLADSCGGHIVKRLHCLSHVVGVEARDKKMIWELRLEREWAVLIFRTRYLVSHYLLPGCYFFFFFSPLRCDHGHPPPRCGYHRHDLLLLLLLPLLLRRPCLHPCLPSIVGCRQWYVQH